MLHAERRRALIAPLLPLLLGTAADAQVARRFGLETPVRDGTVLVSDLWLPSAEGRFPTILVRIPYERGMPLVRPAEHGTFFAEHGYAWMIQDVRGRGDSGGEFGFFRPDDRDGYDTIEWIARQPWSDGRVCMMGVSYLGTVQWLAAREHPPALKCLASTAAAGRWFEELPYLGGAFTLGFILPWTYGTSGRIAQSNAGGIDWDRVFRHRPLLTMDEAAFGRAIPTWRAMLEHDTFDGWWREIFVDSAQFRTIDLPALHVTGWFDWDQPGAMRYWRRMRELSPARDHQYLLTGPWTHPQTWTGGAPTLGEWHFGDAARVDYKPIYLAFFDRYLKQVADTFAFPRARLFFTGVNEWRDFAAYPPAGVRPERLYLRGAGRANTLEGDGALSRAEPGDEPPDRYVYDPRDPTPSTIDFADPRGIDHRPIERREDVLVYTSEVLRDTLVIAGDVGLTLFAATDAPDTDWVAKLLDVQPDGRALKLGASEVGAVRARYRNGYEGTEPVRPGAVEEYRIHLFDVAHVFLPGHRIRVEVASAAFPFLAPNTNTGADPATDTAFRVARQTVHHDRERASFLELPVLPRWPAPR